MNFVIWYCPNCDHRNRDDAQCVKFTCVKCRKIYMWFELDLQEDEDE